MLQAGAPLACLPRKEGPSCEANIQDGSKETDIGDGTKWKEQRERGQEEWQRG